LPLKRLAQRVEFGDRPPRQDLVTDQDRSNDRSSAPLRNAASRGEGRRRAACTERQ
jgi:hypothetical protein